MCLPSMIHNRPWIYITGDTESRTDIGKWMLFFNKSILDNQWILYRTLFEQRQLRGVIAIKVSTMYNNPRASTSNDNGVIIFYCAQSTVETHIMEIGLLIIQYLHDYAYPVIYYKTDTQTRNGTLMMGMKINHTYTLNTTGFDPNILYC